MTHFLDRATGRARGRQRHMHSGNICLRAQLWHRNMSGSGRDMQECLVLCEGQISLQCIHFQVINRAGVQAVAQEMERH